MSKKKKIRPFESAPEKPTIEIETPEPLQFHIPDLLEIPNQLEIWESGGVPCHYARFQTPVPVSVNKEPVFEFKVKPDVDKYKVDSIVWTEHGVIWTANGEKGITALANLIYSRIITQ